MGGGMGSGGCFGGAVGLLGGRLREMWRLLSVMFGVRSPCAEAAVALRVFALGVLAVTEVAYVRICRGGRCCRC